MANMREIRTRINSVQDTMKITNAMYLIASSKLRKARSGRDATDPYFNVLKNTISDILLRTPDTDASLFETEREKEKKSAEKNRIYILISSDKGLAGAYNHDVFRLAESLLEESSRNTLLPVGHMAISYFKNRPQVLIDEEHIYPAAEPTTFRAREIAELVIQQYEDGLVDEVYVVYTNMIDSLRYEPDVFRVLPLSKGMFRKNGEEQSEQKARELVFEPSPEVVLRHIIPNYVKGLIYGAMVESYACEQNARMTAMDNATTNAKDMIRDLSLEYNRVRQAAITQEITEIVNGAESSSH